VSFRLQGLINQKGVTIIRAEADLTMNHDAWIKTCAGWALLIIAASLAYYFVFFLPRERTTRLEMERQERLAREERERERLEMERRQRANAGQKEYENMVRLEDCLAGAYRVYHATWEDTCKKLGRQADCLLPAETADSYNKSHDNLRADCFKRYPQH
jgi:hypothetical protein